MIDENRLIEELRKSNYHHASNSREEALLDRTIRIVQEQPKVNEWIPIEERLPKDGDYLCSFDDGFITRVSFVDGDWELWAESGEVIAWQPLPNPYVKEK